MARLLFARAAGSDDFTRAALPFLRVRRAAGPPSVPPMTVDEMLARARQRLHRLEPHEADDVVRRGGVLVDVRTSEQREHDGTVPGAVAIALNVLEWRADPRSPAHDRRLGSADVPLVVLCAEGYCSSLAAARLVALGRDATDVAGGFASWRASGLPVAGRAADDDRLAQRDDEEV